MNKPKVIAMKQLPTKPPITATIAWFLLLDHFHAPAWLRGALGLWFAIIWTVVIIALYVQVPVELKELQPTREIR